MCKCPPAICWKCPQGTITEDGLRLNIRVGVQYMESWLRGHGCVPLYNLMEDAATAEISRTQVWQWLHNATQLDDGRTIDRRAISQDLCGRNEPNRSRKSARSDFDGGQFELASMLFQQIIEQDELEEFLTLRAYPYLD